MKKLYLTSFKWTSQELKGEVIQDYRLVLVTQSDIDKMFPGGAVFAGESVASKKLLSFMKRDAPHMEILETRSHDAIDGNEDHVQNGLDELQTKHTSNVPPIVFSVAFKASELPPKPRNGNDSDIVLIDLKGYRRQDDFTLGFFDHKEGKWVDTDTSNYVEVTKHMRWMYLPLAKYEK